MTLTTASGRHGCRGTARHEEEGDEDHHGGGEVLHLEPRQDRGRDGNHRGVPAGDRPGAFDDGHFDDPAGEEHPGDQVRIDLGRRQQQGRCGEQHGEDDLCPPTEPHQVGDPSVNEDQPGHIEHHHPDDRAGIQPPGRDERDQQDPEPRLERADHTVRSGELGDRTHRRPHRIDRHRVGLQVGLDGREDAGMQMEVGLGLDDVGRLVSGQIHALGVDEQGHQEIADDHHGEHAHPDDDVAVEQSTVVTGAASIGALLDGTERIRRVGHPGSGGVDGVGCRARRLSRACRHSARFPATVGCGWQGPCR